MTELLFTLFILFAIFGILRWIYVIFKMISGISSGKIKLSEEDKRELRKEVNEGFLQMLKHIFLFK